MVDERAFARGVGCMSQITQKIDALGRREATGLATGVTQRVFATLGASAPANRQAVSLNNTDLGAELWVTLAPTGASAPAISTTDHDQAIPPRTTRQFQVGPSVELWVRSSASGMIAYTAAELL